MGKYGRRPGDVIYIVSLDAYYQLLSDAEFQNLNDIGNAATKIRGEIGQGFVVGERRLVAVQDCVSLDHPADYLGILPSALRDDFTTADLATALRQPRWMAQKIAYVLRTIGVVRVVGKAGNAFLYRRGSGLSDGDDPGTIST